MIVRSGEIRTFRIFEFFNRIRLYETFEYQAASWSKPRWVVVRIAWHPGELFAKTGYIVTNLPFAPKELFRFYNQRGTAEQHIKERHHMDPAVL